MALRPVEVRIEKQGTGPYTWAVIVEGRPVSGCTGLSRKEALYYRTQVREAAKINGEPPRGT